MTASQFALFLGRTTTLCQYEAKSLFSQFSLSFPTESIALFDNASEEEVMPLLELSGGIQKAATIIGTADRVEKVQEIIVTDLEKQPKKVFSLFSQVPDIKSFDFSTQIKRDAALTGRVRFQESKSPVGLSAAVLTHHKVHEYGLFQVDNVIYVAKTIWTQNIDHWSQKDMDKPVRDRKKGMLPPKLARMMINFVSPELRNRPKKRLFDPFCGTGTVLMEGLESGWQVIGADASQKTIYAAGQNMDWFINTFQPKEQTYGLFCQDATQVKPTDLRGPIDAIVTEPFLGKPQPQEHELPNIFKGLEKLFLGFLKNSAKLLPSGGEMVIVTPLVDAAQKQYSLAHVIDKSKAFGYLIVSEPLIYSREQTIVKRAIYHLKKI